MSSKELVACASVSLFCGAIAYTTLKKAEIRAKFSALCERLASEPDISPDLARDAFTYVCVDSAFPTPGHTHPSAAACRTSATNFAKSMSMYIGSGLYIVGMSRSDQRKSMRGSRQWYWAKDTNTENRADNPLPDDIEYICDVDYYLDMPKLLADRSKPTLLYTVVPETAASEVDDTSICFESDGSLRTVVAGGGSYEHFLWDYAGDSVIVKKQQWGFTWKLITYAIERKQVSMNRQLVLLTPIKQFKGLAALLADVLLIGKRLTRFNPIVYGKSGRPWVRFAVHTRKGTQVTTGKPGSLLCATIPESIDSTLHEVAALGSTTIQLPTVVSWIGKDREGDRSSAALLTAYLRDSAPKPLPYVFPVEKGVRAYQYEPHKYDQEARPKIQAFMSPLVHGAFAPVNNEATEKQIVKGRVNDLRKEEPKPNAFRDQCINEFAKFIVRDVVLEPVSFEIIEEKQTRPAQKQSIARAYVNGWFRQMVLKCFPKAEAYMDVKDGRNISMYNDADKLDMASFALPMAEHCKSFAWYAPGKTPLEIATRVGRICNDADFVNISDYHRMDGTITYVLRQVERCVMMKAYPHHRAQLNELLKTNVDNYGILPFGTTFDQGPSHGSGCSATSLFQTLRASFTSYLAYRHVYKQDGSRLSPEEAFEAIGLHLGDDGVDPNLPAEDHLWAAKQVGLVLEANIVPRGDRGVNFLARYYTPEVWYGGIDSMCDVKRQLSKFHTTVRLPQGVTAEHKLVEKCMAYVATDGNTPVIGPFCKKVLVLSQYRPKTLLGVGNWWSKFDDSVQYPNNNVGGWMDVEFDHIFPEFSRVDYGEWLGTATTVQKMLEPPLFADVVPATPAKVPVVVDGEVLDAKAQATTPDADGSTAKRTRKRRPAAKGKVNESAAKKRPVYKRKKPVAT